MEKGTVLGIDVGTTSVKVVIVSKKDNCVVAAQSKETQANVPSDLGAEGNKQDVPKILSAVHSCVSRLPRDLLQRVEAIGICGQMHGVTLWKSSRNRPKRGTLKLEINKDQVSNLFTWQDARCDENFLDSLPKSSSHLSIHTGYGCATLLWFAKHKPEKVEKYDRAGTIQDLVVNLLCGGDDAVTMSDQNASSWGYFLTESCRWDIEALSKTNFPLRLLPPKIMKSGQIAGKLAQGWFDIPAGIPIGVALGDTQCSVYALLKKSSDAVLNISTSAQLAYICLSFEPENDGKNEKIEFRPYFGGKYLAIAASLNGGNTLAAFVKSLQQWVLDLGFSVPQSKVWEKLISAGSEDSSLSSMSITPTLLGERHAPQQTASVEGITVNTMRLGQIFRSLCSGIIKNLHNMMPGEALKSAGITRIVGNGSALVRNIVLQKEVQRWFDLPLEFGHSADAALGAALAVQNSGKLINDL